MASESNKGRPRSGSAPLSRRASTHERAQQGVEALKGGRDRSFSAPPAPGMNPKLSVSDPAPKKESYESDRHVGLFGALGATGRLMKAVVKSGGVRSMANKVEDFHRANEAAEKRAATRDRSFSAPPAPGMNPKPLISDPAPKKESHESDSHVGLFGALGATGRLMKAVVKSGGVKKMANKVEDFHKANEAAEKERQQSAGNQQNQAKFGPRPRSNSAPPKSGGE